jgi:GNAT superfamily N-acetyltransferase
MALRDARREDVAAVVELLADDPLGSTRENAGDLAAYLEAFDAIAADPNNLLLVWDEKGQVAGCLQLTYIPGLSRGGGWRAQVEAVRVGSSHRGRQIGERMMQAVIGMARARGCGLVQLTTDKQRHDAHRFYQRLGFVSSHEGMKLKL